MATLPNFTFEQSNQSKLGGPKWLAGLDIGTQACKLIAGRKLAGYWQIQVASVLRMPAEISAQDVGLRKYLKPWLAECLPSAIDCFASPPSALVEYEMLEWTNEIDNIDSSSATALQEILGDSADLVTHDGWLSGSEQYPTLHLTWMATEAAANLASVINGSGVRCRSIDAPALALARLADVETQTLVIDIGCSEASFVWSRSGRAEYIRNRIRFESESAAHRLARTLEISVASAETLLSHYGIMEDGSDRIARNNARILDEWLNRLLFEIGRTVHYLQNRFGPKAVERIVLCGGGAQIGQLESILGDHLRLPVALPELPIECRWHAAQPYSPLFSQALSLAMMGVMK